MNNNSLLLAKKIYDAINSKSAISVQVLDVHQLTTLTDIFIIAVANNTRQTQAIADEVEEVLTNEGFALFQEEGYSTAQWILLDYGNVIAHILYKEDASFYALDRLWKDAKIVSFE